VTILPWNTTSHGPDSEAAYDSGFFFVGIAVAAWMLGRHLLSRVDELVEEDEAAREAITPQPCGDRPARGPRPP
jgi:hypothetical protein